MSRGRIHASFQGRFGNCAFTYCFARAFAEKHDLELTTDPWSGEDVFDIPLARGSDDLPRRDENTIQDTDTNIVFRSYAQQQKCLIYSRADVRRWLKFKPHIEDAMGVLKPEELLAHRRVGDYPGYQYPVISQSSYIEACRQFGLDENKLKFITEEEPTLLPGPWPDFLPDFWRLSHCKTLLRGNSSFSWWAATLGHGEVYSPVIEGKPGGVETDYPFVKGNHPRFNSAAFLTDLHLRDE